MTPFETEVLTAMNAELEARGYSTNGPRIPEALAQWVAAAIQRGALAVAPVSEPAPAPSRLAPVVSDAISHTEATT